MVTGDVDLFGAHCMVCALACRRSLDAAEETRTIKIYIQHRYRAEAQQYKRRLSCLSKLIPKLRLMHVGILCCTHCKITSGLYNR